MNRVSFKSNPARPAVRVLAIVALAAACAAMAGCASDVHMAGSTSPWAAAGNNGGKVDRYAIGRAAAMTASSQLASGPAGDPSP